MGLVLPILISSLLHLNRVFPQHKSGTALLRYCKLVGLGDCYLGLEWDGKELEVALVVVGFVVEALRQHNMVEVSNLKNMDTDFQNLVVVAGIAGFTASMVEKNMVDCMGFGFSFIN